MAEHPVTEWLREGGGPPGDGQDARMGATGAGEAGDRAEAAWRPEAAWPEAEPADAGGRARRLWRIAATAWAGLVIGVAVLLVGGRLVGAEVGSGPAPQAEAGGSAGGSSGGSAGAEVPDAGTADAAAPPPPPVAAPPATDGAEDASAAPDPSAAPGLAGAPTSPEMAEGPAAAAALVAVRLGLTSAAEPARYVDLVHPESTERHGDVVIVTVAAVILEGRDGRWTAARAARYGVAVDTGGAHPRALGAPWPLLASDAPVPEPPAVVPLSEEIDGEALLEALVAAGYRDATVEGGLPGAPAPLVRVRITAVAPGEDATAAHDVWLGTDGGLRVLGDGAPS